ncbi:winged helix-turn-helix domain-containing protein [Enterococcus sp. BWB1-3]|uniref:winged helix-turn-helix domain-containing protein n=1 Tax=Enterococcus sp. BWB1-3 TaxID=2787713 RepID=UPI001F02F1D7|nr:winged helix-turn-helix domain-containing protein [Enterococcus sp. BWB1-3]
MHQIGYLVSNNQKSGYIDSILDNQLYKFRKLDEEEFSDLSSLEGIVLEETSATDVSWVCNLLMKIREKSDVLVWVLSPNTAVPKTMRIVYLQLGADGVVDSSNDLDEFSLIVKNALERHKMMEFSTIEGTQVINESDSVSRKKNEAETNFELLPKNLSVRLKDGKEIDLTKLEFMTIQYLHKHAKETVTYEELYENVWKESGKLCKYRVSNMIFHLRRKIETDEKDPKYIKNVRSMGYKLVI